MPSEPTPRQVIARAIDEWLHNGKPGGIVDQADAILAALAAAGFAVVPRKPTERMKAALNGWAVCAGYIEEGWAAACDAAAEAGHE
jgi:hypothetical protein